MSLRGNYRQALERPVQLVHPDPSTQQQQNNAPVIAMIAFAASAHMAHDVMHHTAHPLSGGPL